MEKRLHEIYLGDSENARRGPKALLKQAKIEGVRGVTLAKCKEAIKSLDVYTLYRRRRVKFPRNRIEANFPGECVQVDLADLAKFSAENDGYRMVLLALDTYSKYLLAVPLKTKATEEIRMALLSVVDAAPFKLFRIYSDQEPAILSKQVKAALRAYDIVLYTTTSIVKAPGVERWIRTLRLRLQRYFEQHKSFRWLEYFPRLVRNHNRTVSSVTGQTPNDLVSNPLIVPKARPPLRKSSKKLPPVGAQVRLSRLREFGQKEATGTYSTEVFVVSGHKTSTPIPMAYIKDMKGEQVKGSFYPEELQEVRWDGSREVAEILKRRRRKGHPPEVLVRYRNWPDKFNEWLLERELPK